jgi:hypothetical protein
MGARGVVCFCGLHLAFLAILFHASVSAIHRAPLFLESAPVNNLLSKQKIESSPRDNFHLVAINKRRVSGACAT